MIGVYILLLLLHLQDLIHGSELVHWLLLLMRWWSAFLHNDSLRFLCDSRHAVRLGLDSPRVHVNHRLFVAIIYGQAAFLLVERLWLLILKNHLIKGAELFNDVATHDVSSRNVIIAAINGRFCPQELPNRRRYSTYHHGLGLVVKDRCDYWLLGGSDHIGLLPYRDDLVVVLIDIQLDW